MNPVRFDLHKTGNGEPAARFFVPVLLTREDLATRLLCYEPEFGFVTGSFPELNKREIDRRVRWQLANNLSASEFWEDQYPEEMREHAWDWALRQVAKLEE